METTIQRKKLDRNIVSGLGVLREVRAAKSNGAQPTAQDLAHCLRRTLDNGGSELYCPYCQATLEEYTQLFRRHTATYLVCECDCGKRLAYFFVRRVVFVRGTEAPEEEERVSQQRQANMAADQEEYKPEPKTEQELARIERVRYRLQERQAHETAGNCEDWVYDPITQIRCEIIDSIDDGQCSCECGECEGDCYCAPEDVHEDGPDCDFSSEERYWAYWTTMDEDDDTIERGGFPTIEEAIDSFAEWLAYDEWERS